MFSSRGCLQKIFEKFHAVWFDPPPNLRSFESETMILRARLVKMCMPFSNARMQLLHLIDIQVKVVQQMYLLEAQPCDDCAVLGEHGKRIVYAAAIRERYRLRTLVCVPEILFESPPFGATRT